MWGHKKALFLLTMFVCRRQWGAGQRTQGGVLPYKNLGSEAPCLTCPSSQHYAQTQLYSHHQQQQNLTNRLLLQQYLQEQWRRGAKVRTEHQLPPHLHQGTNASQQPQLQGLSTTSTSSNQPLQQHLANHLPPHPPPPPPHLLFPPSISSSRGPHTK